MVESNKNHLKDIQEKGYLIATYENSYSSTSIMGNIDFRSSPEPRKKKRPDTIESWLFKDWILISWLRK